jgi:hypothetical protein
LKISLPQRAADNFFWGSTDEHEIMTRKTDGHSICCRLSFFPEKAYKNLNEVLVGRARRAPYLSCPA